MADLASLRFFQASQALWGNNDSMSLNCSGDLTRPSCFMHQTEFAKRDSIAVLRSILSALSLLSTFSIILSAIAKRRVLSPKVHPIFMLSIADFILAIFWMIGGGLWLSRGSVHFNSDRDGCFIVLLATVILECVTVNLTCVYALLAYSGIRQKDFSNVYSLFEKDAKKHVWKPWATIIVYVISWTAPVVFILVPFFTLNSHYGLIKQADACTCWCIPFFGNILPHANSMDRPTEMYLYRLSKFVLAYSLVVQIHYVMGFVLLLLVYWGVLARIRKMRKLHRERASHHNLYGATEAIIIKGQSEAKTRVIIFLTIFIISGFFNVVLSVLVVLYAVNKLTSYNMNNRPVPTSPHSVPLYAYVAYILQSITIPLQGFLNAIVYGWTRKDFVQAVRAPQDKVGIVVPTPVRGSVYQQQQPRSRRHPFALLDEREEEEEEVDTSVANLSTGILHALSENSDSN